MIPHPEDTIVALSSARGPALRAIVRLTGPQTRSLIARHFSQPLDPSRRVLLSGTVTVTRVQSPVPVDLYFWPAPHTYTGQDLAEWHLISSPPLVDQLLADLQAAGARPAQPGEFTLRAFLAGKKDLTQAEAVLGVIEAPTDADLRLALGQLAGGVTRPLDKLRSDLLDLLADVEAGLDFVDEDIEFVDQTALLFRIAAGLAHLTNLRRQLEDRSVNRPAIRVAFVGLPNAGKSSLFNALTRQSLALVSEQAGTTRDYLVRSISLDNQTIELIDTAGWQSAQDSIEDQAQRLGSEATRQADVILWCAEVGTSFDREHHHWLESTRAVVLRVQTKIDRGSVPVDPSVIRTSTRSEAGVESLRQALSEQVAALVRPPLAPSLSRCRGHVERGLQALRRAHEHTLAEDAPELLALALREALDQIGELAGAVYTDDLLDRIFSRFCIGK